MNEIKIVCPATIANLSCGFDVLGLCLDNVGDEMIIRKSTEKGVRITKIEGADLPLETENNVAGVALLAMLEEVEADFGFHRAFDNSSRLFNKSLGGGSLLDIGIYPIFAALSTLGVPNSIKAEATTFDNGADSSCNIVFNYKNGVTANLKSIRSLFV